MFLYSKSPVNYSIFDGEITLNGVARDYLRETIFHTDAQNRDIQLIIDGKNYKARLMNVLSSSSVQISYGVEVKSVLSRIFAKAKEYWRIERQKAHEHGYSTRQIPDQTSEYISVVETDEPFVYEVLCYSAGAFDKPNQPRTEATTQSEDFHAFPEGRIAYVTHAKRERSPIVTQLAKQRFIDLHGKVYCEVCGFSFSNTYGDVGKDFIEAHHIIPVSDLGDNGQTKVEDICLVCSNCHRMLHRKRPWINADQLKELLETQ